MPLQYAAGLALVWAALLYPISVFAESGHPISLCDALRRALAANPRLTAAEKDVRIATGRRRQAGAFPNPEASFDLDNAFGSGELRGLEDAETTLQISQLIELGGKREARNSRRQAARLSALAPCLPCATYRKAQEDRLVWLAPPRSTL